MAPVMTSLTLSLSRYHNLSPENIALSSLSSLEGAAYQCWSSRVCPDFVLYQDFDQHTSSLWPEYVHVQFMSSICPQNQTFVLIKSRLCPHGPTYVLFLSSHQALINWKTSRQILVKFWKCLHFNLPSRNPAPRQNLDIVWTRRCPTSVLLLATNFDLTPQKTSLYLGFDDFVA